MLRSILAACILCVAAHAAQTVEGHVVNSVTGAGIPDVGVQLIQAGKSAYSAATDAQGRFRIEAVQDGTYTARYRAASFWPVPNLLDNGGQQPFPVAAGGDPVRLRAQLQPIPRISGRVLDASGKPVPNATLWLLWESNGCSLPACFAFSHQSKTGAKGEYTMGDPDVPGTWLLSAAAPSSWPPPESHNDQRLAWAQTFYPGVTDPQLAVRLTVQPGVDLSNLDIKLAAVPVHRVRGTVLDDRGNPVPNLSVTMGKGLGPNLDQDTKDDGTFEFESVPDDEWRLAGAAEIGGVNLWATQSVRVKGRDVEKVELRLAAPFSIRGKVVVEVPAGKPSPRLPTIMLAFYSGASQASDMPRISTGSPDAKGDFTIRNLYPGPSQILPPVPPEGYYLDSIRLGGYDALESDLQILSDAQPLIVTFKPGGGTVRGAIEACVAGRVFLIPQNAALRRKLLRTTSCAPNGGFEFLAVRPGEYYGLAIAGNSPTPWFEVTFDDTRLSQAARVTVRPRETSTDDIRLITR